MNLIIGTTYTTKFATAEKFTLHKIILRKIKIDKTTTIEVPYILLGIYEKSSHLGLCPIQPERLIIPKAPSKFCANKKIMGGMKQNIMYSI